MAGTITQLPNIVEGELRLLVRRFQAGEREALGELYDRYYDAVFGAARRILRCEADAEDVTQWTFLKAWAARERLRDPTKIRGWLTRIAANRAKNVFVGRSRWASDEHALGGLAEGPVAERAMVQAEERRELYAAIATLSPRQHDVMRLRLEQELTFAEIGARLGCSNGSARVNYTYGVQNLKSKLRAQAVA